METKKELSIEFKDPDGEGDSFSVKVTTTLATRIQPEILYLTLQDVVDVVRKNSSLALDSAEDRRTLYKELLKKCKEDLDG